MPPHTALAPYRRKRRANHTAEPFGGAAGPHVPRFVAQLHAARRLHYDLRLQWGGVLWSWAVPKGPSLDPSHRRLAVQVEDHPVEYAYFEGVIAADNYGAGAVIVWDMGQWSPREDPSEGLAKGKLLFDLHGYKLSGTWTLVQTRSTPKHWLLMPDKKFKLRFAVLWRASRGPTEPSIRQRRCLI